MKPIFIIAGEKKSGKTTFLINVISLLQLNGVVVGGFIALHEMESDCYQIKDITTNEQTPLMQRVSTFEKRPHHFELFPKGVEMGNNYIQKLLEHCPDIAIIDEIGGYELRGKLWSNGFTKLVESKVPLIFTVKERLLDKIIDKWSIAPSLVFRPGDFSNPNEAFECIMGFLLETSADNADKSL